MSKRLTCLTVGLRRTLRVQVGVPVVASGPVRIRCTDVEAVAEVAESRVTDVEVEIKVDERLGGPLFGDRDRAAGELVNRIESKLVFYKLKFFRAATVMYPVVGLPKDTGSSPSEGKENFSDKRKIRRKILNFLNLVFTYVHSLLIKIYFGLVSQSDSPEVYVGM